MCSCVFLCVPVECVFLCVPVECVFLCVPVECVFLCVPVECVFLCVPVECVFLQAGSSPARDVGGRHRGESILRQHGEGSGSRPLRRRTGSQRLDDGLATANRTAVTATFAQQRFFTEAASSRKN